VSGKGKEVSIPQCRRKLGSTTSQVLDLLHNEDFVGNVKTILELAHQSVDYHVGKLEDLDLVEKTEKTDGRQYYRATEKGREVIEGVNVPPY